MASPTNLSKPFALLLFLVFVLCRICNGDNVGNVLLNDQRINNGVILKNGNYTLVFQRDCRLGLYDAGKRVWASGNHGQHIYCYPGFDGFGNLYIQSRNRGVLWSALKKLEHPSSHYVLILQNDRNLVIYGPPVWSAPGRYHVHGQMDVTNMIADDADDKGCVLYTGQRLNAGESLRAGSSSLVMQDDCNLVLYEGDKPTWATNTNGGGQNCYLQMRNDGNLVVYRSDFRELWSAFDTRKDQGNCVLVLVRERIVIFGTPIWASGSQVSNTMLAINVTNTRTDTITSASGVAAA